MVECIFITFYGCCQCANLECAYTYSSPFLHTISENGHKKCLLKIAIFTNGEFLYIPYGVSETSVLVECIFITFYVCCQCANLHIQCGIQLVPCNNRPSPLDYVYNVQCAMYMHCTYIPTNKLQYVHCTLYNVHCTTFKYTYME